MQARRLSRGWAKSRSCTFTPISPRQAQHNAGWHLLLCSLTFCMLVPVCTTSESITIEGFGRHHMPGGSSSQLQVGSRQRLHLQQHRAQYEAVLLWGRCLWMRCKQATSARSLASRTCPLATPFAIRTFLSHSQQSLSRSPRSE